ncbi:hypothetical protein ES332_D06G145400v1 [Gossypium tomentosum]|uniref:MADS-box domain-containing protein n=1 Tax=Gossypium tomentosum TaxID=34277 RepID=A0A5D2KIY8_GOSTO|nr:hypothetical protein ES332_D06G145400v1 [Gossypium tomentosum]
MVSIFAQARKQRENKKIEIKIIENEDNRLSTLCGGEILFIIFSPAGKPYSFGHPSIESVAKFFSNASQPLNGTTDAPVEAYRKVRMNLLVQYFNKVQDQLDAIKEKQKAIALAQQSHGTEIHHCWKTPIDQLNLRELYEQDEHYTEFINFIFVTRDKKIATISSIHALMEENVCSSFPPRYGIILQ